MKTYLLFIVLFINFQSFSQTSSEKEILKLSAKIFQWEVDNKIDSLANVFHEKFVVLSSDGSSQFKDGYLNRLKSGNFIHESIDVEENAATVTGNTAIVTGKGKFAVSISGKKVALRLSYIEVFTRVNHKKPWQVLAMKASIIQ
ncbi:nuclear transport factor 2 family protein [Flavobacterium sp. LT1R49]|uniref:nuclear transport factor 2 family protein n=1 Tax=Flavobacterium arabinosi TaxID=3398737 RepID=UPI003A8B9D61